MNLRFLAQLQVHFASLTPAGVAGPARVQLAEDRQLFTAELERNPMRNLRHALPILLLAVGLCLAGCASVSVSEAELSGAADCLEGIGMQDVHIVKDQVLYTVAPEGEDLPTTKAAIAACVPGATPESVLKAVTG